MIVDMCAYFCMYVSVRCLIGGCMFLLRFLLEYFLLIYQYGGHFVMPYSIVRLALNMQINANICMWFHILEAICMANMSLKKSEFC